MSLTEIENLTVVELKEQREQLIESAKQVPPAELAGRYVQARLDAKQRDEKLAEQGKTISHLDELLAQFKADSEELRAALLLATREMASVRESASQTAAADAATVTSLKESLAKETARANRLKAEAARNHVALSASAKLLNDALAAQSIDNADNGE